MKTLRTLVIALTVLQANHVYSQSRVVAPSEFVDTDAPGVADNLAANYRLQQVNLAELFSGIAAPNNVMTGLAWRTDGNLDVPIVSTGERLIVKLSTTSKGLDDLDLEFAANIGPDETVVFDGPIVWNINDTDPVGGPRDFEFKVPFSTPFTYDPSAGNLLLELEMTGASERLGLDFAGPIDSSATTRFLWNGGGPDADPLRALDAPLGGHVVEFSFVPEPSPSILLIVAMAVPHCRRRSTSRFDAA